MNSRSFIIRYINKIVSDLYHLSPKKDRNEMSEGSKLRNTVLTSLALRK
jgi:hypothetical protein